MKSNRRDFLLAASATALFGAPASAAAPSRRRFDKVDYIQVIKSKRRLDLIGGGRILKSYPIRLGNAPVGAKHFQGDGKTPEGSYRIDRRNVRSQYFRSLGVSYPNRSDRARAARRGKSPGGDIFVHGQPNGLNRTLDYDWTAGCIALSNEHMAELWAAIPIGCPIRIYA